MAHAVIVANAAGAYAEWMYFGYGCRLWSRKDVDAGIPNVYITAGGAVVEGPVGIDLYAAAGTPSAVVYTFPSRPLGFYRLRITVTATKNAASSGYHRRAGGHALTCL